MRTVRARVATSHPTGTAYGRIVIPENVMQSMASELAGGKIPLTFNHNSDYAITATNISAGVEDLDDGYRAVWIEFDVPDDEWNFVQSQFDERGVKGGFSFTATELISAPASEAGFFLAADAHHFSDDVIRTASEALPADYGVRIERAYQFTIIPEAAAFLTFTVAVLQGVPANLLSQMIYNALSNFIRPGGRSVFNLRLKKSANKIVTTVRIETSDATELRRMIEQLPDTFNNALRDFEN